MWNCTNCHEKIEDHFDACWNCGTDKDGNRDPNFGRASVSDTSKAARGSTCPHCGHSIERGSRNSVPNWKYDPGGQTVSLGCGTLILIAIIVSIFSQGKGAKDEIITLRQELQSLDKKMDALQASIRNISPRESVPER